MKEIILIMVIHFLADFGLQTHDQATKKSESIKWLFYHVSVYSIMWIFVTPILFDNIDTSVSFIIITFWTHLITDYSTSRIGKPFWNKNDYHNGFVVVGFDQLIHHVTLFGTYMMLK